MNILLFFSQHHNSTGSDLVQILEKYISNGQLKLCDSIDGLVQIMRSQIERYEIAVLWAATKNELALLVTLQDLMEHMPIILILPDQSKSTLSVAHKLFPRLISFHDSDVAIVESVVNKICQNRKL